MPKEDCAAFDCYSLQLCSARLYKSDVHVEFLNNCPRHSRLNNNPRNCGDCNLVRTAYRALGDG